VKHTDFLKSLKALKSHFTKKQKPLNYTSYTTNNENICICKNSNGEFKYLYKSREELDYMLASKSINLKSYPCPYEKGWHLTKG
jgi:hypothetical protein